MADVSSTGRLVGDRGAELAIKRQRLQVMAHEQQLLRYEVEVADMENQIEARREAITETTARLAEERQKLEELNG